MAQHLIICHVCGEECLDWALLQGSTLCTDCLIDAASLVLTRMTPEQRGEFWEAARAEYATGKAEAAEYRRRNRGT